MTDDPLGQIFHGWMVQQGWPDQAIETIEKLLTQNNVLAKDNTDLRRQLLVTTTQLSKEITELRREQSA